MTRYDADLGLVKKNIFIFYTAMSSYSSDLTVRALTDAVEPLSRSSDK